MILLVILILSLICIPSANAQGILRLKSRNSQGTGFLSSELASLRRRTMDRLHRVLHFQSHPTQQDLARLSAQGVRVLQYIPDHALLVSAPDTWNPSGSTIVATELLTPGDKWSAQLGSASAMQSFSAVAVATAPTTYLVEFYPDVTQGDSRSIVTQEGLRIREHADLLPNHLLVEGSEEQVRKLTEWDEVAYVFPASDDLDRGLPTRACGGPVTDAGPVGMYVSQVGDGWDGPGRNAMDLRYSIQKMTQTLPEGAGPEEFAKALAEWSRHVVVNFTQGGQSSDARHLNVTFATRSHGDPFPFDGAGRVLAHTFYPAPPNPEPIAGDLHFDDDEAWRIGGDPDFYSVALHELGHALGLGHSDRPGAVMYAYYRRATTLTDEDISAIRGLYAARDASAPQPPAPPAEPPAQPTPAPAPNPPSAPAAPPSTPPSNPPTPPSSGPDTTPPSLEMVSPATNSAVTAAATFTLRGMASDNRGVAQVNWTSNTSSGGLATGTTEWSAQVPLLVGYNYFVVRAVDAAGNFAWRSVVIRRQ